jgi:hypothetical protein
MSELEIREAAKDEIAMPARPAGNGDTFKVDVIIDNMRVNGLYLRIPRKIRQSSQTCFALRLSTDLSDVSHKMMVAIRGVVLRGEPKSDGTWGVAVAFARYRVLFFMRDHYDCSWG